MNFIDLTHTVTDNMPVFPGDPPMTLRNVANIKEHGYTDHALATYMHVGTHIDAPLHMIAGGKRISELPPEKFTGPGVLVDVRGKTDITADVLKNKKIVPGSVVLLFSDFSKKYKTPGYDTNYPDIHMDFADALVEKKVNIIGIDFINPDTDETYPIHKKLLGNEILIIENLTNLDQLTGAAAFEVFAFPLKLFSDASPVRVITRI